MKKIYSVPTLTYHMVGTKNMILDDPNNFSGGSPTTMTSHMLGNERNDDDMNYASGSDEGTSTSGFGSSDSPWEKLW